MWGVKDSSTLETVGVWFFAAWSVWNDSYPAVLPRVSRDDYLGAPSGQLLLIGSFLGGAREWMEAL